MLLSQGHFAINLWFPYTLLNLLQISHFENTIYFLPTLERIQVPPLCQICLNYTCLDIYVVYFLVCKNHYFNLLIVTLCIDYYVIERESLS